MIFIGIALLLLSFPIYYYVVKVKGATEKSWKYSVFIVTNIMSCLRISQELIEMVGGVSEDITWWDLASFGIMLVLHMISIVIAQILWGAPAQANIPTGKTNN